MPLRWASCLFRPAKGRAASLELNSSACPAELQELLSLRGTGCLRQRGAHIIYERIDDAGQGAFTPPVVIYIKRLPVCGGVDVCVKRTLITHFVGRAAREARLQVQLQNPHLLPAYASLRGRHHYYLVLPAAESDLWAEAEAMRQQGAGYSEIELREVARQILLGLDHLHASGLAHRDIKPANVLRLSDGRVVVADFGCTDGCTTGFVAAGTTQFQPPECRRNAGAQLAVLPKSYDQRLQDMWSLGATLASLWFARLPDVIRGSGSSRIPAAAAAVTAVADAAAAFAAPTAVGGGDGGDEDNPGISNCSAGRNLNCTGVAKAVEAVAAAAVEVAGKAVLDVAAAAAAAPSLPRFLAAAGFASCGSTVGARGEPMSPLLLDLLSRLLRLRPSERCTASQALQHEWLLAAGSRGGGEVAAAVPAMASMPPSAVRHATADERFMPSVSPQQIVFAQPAAVTASGTASVAAAAAPLRPRPPSSPTASPVPSGVTTPTAASISRAAAAAAAAGHPERTQPDQAEEEVGTAAAAALRRRHLKGLPSSPSASSSPHRSSGLSLSHEDAGSSPASATSRSPGEAAQRLALRQQQQQQDRQQGTSSSSWLLRPSLSHGGPQPANPKRVQRAILRVFVGASGESSGSN